MWGLDIAGGRKSLKGPPLKNTSVLLKRVGQDILGEKKKTWREMGQYADCKSSLIGTNVIYK